eukprot:COSAG06_NODE_47973_length_335_cov_1.084746_1_plen_77_part_01
MPALYGSGGARQPCAGVCTCPTYGECWQQQKVQQPEQRRLVEAAAQPCVQVQQLSTTARSQQPLLARPLGFRHHRGA